MKKKKNNSTTPSNFSKPIIVPRASLQDTRLYINYDDSVNQIWRSGGRKSNSPPPKRNSKKKGRTTASYISKDIRYERLTRGRLRDFLVFRTKDSVTDTQRSRASFWRGPNVVCPKFRHHSPHSRFLFEDQNFGRLIRLLRHLNRIYKHVHNLLVYICPQQNRHPEMGKLFFSHLHPSCIYCSVVRATTFLPYKG